MKRPSSIPTAGLRPFAFLALIATIAARSGPEAGAQAMSGGDMPVSSTPAKTQKLADLTSRYRFSERYTADDEHTGPGLIGSCRVGIVEVSKDSVDTAQGAPKRAESTRHAIFKERPAEMSGLGNVASVTRIFERYQTRPEESSKAMGGRPLEGLSVLIRPKVGELPVILGLTDGRSLTEYEFDVAARQVFVPQLAMLLPTQVVRVGDTWRIARKATQAMLGEPSIQGETLVAKLSGVGKEVDGPRLVASIAINGRLSGPIGDTTVNAEALFTFQAEATPKAASARPPTSPRPTEDVIEARGAITELRLAKVTSGPLPGPGRLRFQSNRELTMHRQVGLGPGAVAPPKVEKAPEITEANSWLAHVDPAGRYSFRHPQELLAPDRAQPAARANTTLLTRTRREGRDSLQVEYVGKTLAPEDLKKELAEEWDVFKMEVIKGGEEWLPEADWPRMKVHRIEAAVKLADPKAKAATSSTRVHFDGYLILFGQSASILAIATTSRDAVAPFRREVEQVLKSIRLDPPPTR